MGHHKRHHVLHRQFRSSHRQQPRLLPLRSKALRRALVSNVHHSDRLRLYLNYWNLRLLILKRHLRKTHLESSRSPRLFPQRRRHRNTFRRLHHRRLFHPCSTGNEHRSQQHISRHRHDRPRTQILNHKKGRIHLRHNRSPHLPLEPLKRGESIHNLSLCLLRFPLLNRRRHHLRLLCREKGIHTNRRSLLRPQKRPLFLHLWYPLACLYRIHSRNLNQYHRFPRCLWLGRPQNGRIYL